MGDINSAYMTFAIEARENEKHFQRKRNFRRGEKKIRKKREGEHSDTYRDQKSYEDIFVFERTLFGVEKLLSAGLTGNFPSPSPKMESKYLKSPKKPTNGYLSI